MKQIIQKYRLWLICLMGAMMFLPDSVWGQGVWVYGQDKTFSCTINGNTETINSTRHTEKKSDSDGNVTTYEGEISHIQLNSGTLILDNIRQLASVTATGGTIQIQNPQSSSYSPTISKLRINGDVTIIGASNSIFDYLSEDMVISGGNVTLLDIQIALSKNTVGIEGGNVTMKSVSYPHLSDYASIPYVILQTGGELTFIDCEFSNNGTLDDGSRPKYIVQTEGGTCCLNDDAGQLEIGGFNVANTGILKVSGGKFGVYRGQLIPFFLHVSKGGHLIIEDGVFNGSIPVEEGELTINGGTFCGLQSKKGKVIINGGNFNATNLSINEQQINKPVIIEGGSLAITGGEFTAAEHNSVTAAIQILADAEVALSGGFYNELAFHIDPSVGITPEQMLASGYGYYTLEQRLQPDVRYKSDAIQKANGWIQVKALSGTEPAGYGREEALKADVGPKGKDVTVKGNQSPYDYEINTPEGLLWLMTAINGYWSENFEVELPKVDYYKINSASEVRITSDLDMSGYDWVPIYRFSSALLDGQNHRIYNLNVNQACAAFIQDFSGGLNSTLANLVVNGTFKSKNTKYKSGVGFGSSGLVFSNWSGYIVNCGVEQSTLESDFTNEYEVKNAGLVAVNSKTIQNCYFTGNIKVKSTYTKTPSFSNSNKVSGRIWVGGIAADCWNGGTVMENTYACYTKPVPDIVIAPGLEDDVKIYNDLVAKKNDGVIVKDCFEATDPEDALEALNKAVDAYKPAEGEIPWKEWICKEGRNDGYPILGEKNKPSVIDFPFTLQVKGPGIFEGYYTTGEGEEGKKTFRADTTLYFTNERKFHLTAKPDKGATLVDVVGVVNIPELPGALEDSIRMEDVKPHEEFPYLAKQAITLVATFRTDTLYLEKDTTVIGGTDEVTTVDKVEISAGTEEKPATVSLGNVTVNPESGSGDAETNITTGANVIVELSGTNTLGTFTNNGTVTLEKSGEEVSLVAQVVNKGKLVDNTGLITEVLDDSRNLLLSVANGTSGGNEITEGKTVSLTATATLPEGAIPTFRWQRRNKDGIWEDTGVPVASSQKNAMQPRSRAQLRSGIATATHTDTYTEALSAVGTYDYRCLVTHEVVTAGGGATSPSVSTTLSLYNTVTVKSDNPTPNPPVPAVTYYTITLPSVSGATTDPEAGDHAVEEGDSFSFTLTLDAAYSQSEPVVKAGDEILVPNAYGRYTISEVYSDLTISITGIMPDVPTANEEVALPIRVWSHEGILHLYSETRETVRIITLDGRIHKTIVVSGYVTETNVPRGFYIVQIKDQIFKLSGK